MGKENKTPHLDKWLRTFKSVGKVTGTVISGISSDVAPGITSSVREITSAGREAKNAFNDSRYKVKHQLVALNRTISGKNAQSILNNAFTEIKNGSFSLDKLSDSSYDSIDDYDDVIDGIDIDPSDPASVALGESKKNMAILGKTVAEGNAATIAGMKQMTTTLSNIQIKTSQASTAKMANIAMTGLNQLSSQLSGVNGRLDVINKNLITLIDFQRDNVAQTNVAALQYYSESSRMMSEMGAVISEIKDFMDNQKSLSRKKNEEDFDPYDMSSGFDFSNYKKLVKNNFNNSELGMAMSMLGMVKSVGGMASGLGGSPLEMALSFAGGKLLPKKTRESIARLDKAFIKSIDETLYRIGDMRYSSDLFKSIIGSLLGKERQDKLSKANLGNFKKDTMGWNGIAQKTLVEVIPSYLSRIEASLTKKDERFYNMDTGQFMTRKDIEKMYAHNFSNNIEFGLSSFSNELEEALKKSNVSKENVDKIYRNLNKIVNDQSLGNLSSKDSSRAFYDSLKGHVSENSVRDLTMSFIESMDDVKKSLNNFSKSIEEEISGSIYRNIFNENQNHNRYHINAEIKAGRKFSDSGRAYDEMSEEELARIENSERISEGISGFINKIKNKFKRGNSNRQRENLDSRISSRIDTLTNSMYDRVYGFNNTSSGHTSSHVDEVLNEAEAILNSNVDRYSNTISSQNNRATSALDNKKQAGEWKDGKKVSKINQLQKEISRTKLKDVLDGKDSKSTDSAQINDIMTGEKEQSDRTSLKALVIGLYSNFLKPMTSSIFGKNGFFANLLNKEKFKKIKNKLFDEKTGIFSGVTKYFKDQMDYLKYIFTGKGYTNRQNKTFPDRKEDSVFGYLTKGYDFIFRNTMTYLFGDKFTENETYKKYFSWLDIKGRKARKADKAKEKKSVNKSADDVKSVSEITDSVDELLSENKSNSKKSVNKKVRKKNIEKARKMASRNKSTAIVHDNIITASEEAADKITSSAKQMSDSVFGDEKKINETAETGLKSIKSKIKQNLPKTATAGVIGGAVGLSTMIHGAGVLGSLFLPGGPIGGAIAGMGLHLISKTKGFSEFLFGKEDADGKRRGGLITQKTADAVKKSMPLIIGASTLGLVKSIFKSSIGLGSGAGGFLLDTLLPGGPIGGAIVGLGIGLLKNNERFKEILFGKKDKDGKLSGGKLSNGMNTLNRIFKKSGGFIKGGAKGLAVGSLASLALGKMGIFGAAIAGGPIGLGIAGLGIGIASQTKKFQELLFGTEEFDENGNFKGRAGNGLLTKVRNMLVINVLEPIKDNLQAKVEDFAFYLKKTITYPFRLAFGPILDSLKGVKKDISDAIHEAFNNIAETVGKALKLGVSKLFSPLTFLLKNTFKVITGGITTGLKLALLPISAPLKLLEFMTGKKRRAARKEERKSIFQNAGEIYNRAKERWTVEDEENADKYKGFGGRINKFLTHGRDLIEGYDAAKIGYRKGLRETGYNSLGWMDVADEMKGDKVNRKGIRKNRKVWKNIDAERKAIMKSVNFADPNFTSEEYEKIRKKITKMGVDRRTINSDEDLELFIKNKNEWKAKLDPSKSTKIEDIAKNGIKINETNEQINFRRHTESYQKKVISRFDDIIKYFTKIGIKQGLSGRRNLDINSIRELDNELKNAGLTWDDIGYDPSDLVDISTLNDETYEEFLKQKFSNGEVTNANNTFSKTIKDSLNNDSAVVETLNNINEGIQTNAEVSKANLTLQANETMGSGVSGSDIYKTTGYKITGKLGSVANSIKGRFKRKEKDSAEEIKDKYLKGATSLQNKDKTIEDEAVIEGVSGESKSKKRGTVFETIKGGVKNILGSVFNIFSSKTFWKIAGAGLTITALYGGKIKEFFDPILSKVGTFLQEKVLPFIGDVAVNVSSFISTNLPGILETMTTNIVNNMEPIITSFGKVLWSAISTMGKLAINKLSSSITGKELFDVGGSSSAIDSKTGKTYNSVEEANEAVTQSGNTGANIHENSDGTATVMGSYTDVDENGNAVNITNSSLKSSLLREGVQFARSKTNRTLAKATIKGAGKVVGTATMVIPGFKLTKAAFRGVGATGKVAAKGVKKAGSAIINGVSTLNAKRLAKKGVTEVGGAVLEDATSNKKVIKTFLSKAKNMISKAADLVKDKIKPGKFKNFVDDLIKTITEKMSKASNGVLKKIGDKITTKIAQATGRTVASATVILGLGFAIWDGVNGALNASYLFGINDSDVTAGMRVVSSIMEILLGTGPGAWIDICLEVLNMLTGINAKQWMARSLYKAMGGDSELLDEATLRLELETKKYNKANGTNLSTAAYNEKKNSSNSISGRIKKGATWLFNRDKYNEKYNYDAYEVTDEELKEYKNSASASNSSNTTEGNGTGNKNKYSKLTKDQMKALGYGTLQSDSRWGNYQLGTFPDGSVSTMSTGGCGPTALSMVANTFGNNVSPLTIGQYAKNGGYIKDGGSTSALFTDGASRLGLQAKNLNPSNIKSELENGNPIILSGKSHSSDTPYTSAGHIIMAYGVDGNGNIKVNDPMRGSVSMPVNKLTSGMTHGWSYSKAVGYGSPTAGVTSYLNDVITENGTIDASKITPTKVKTLNRDVKNYYDKGYTKYSDGRLRFNIPDFYNGMTVEVLSTLGKQYPKLLTDQTIPLFRLMYAKYCNNSYPSDKKLTTMNAKQLLDQNPEAKEIINNQKYSRVKVIDTSNGLTEALSSIASGFASVVGNLATSLLTGEEYQSVFTEESPDAENIIESSSTTTPTAGVSSFLTGVLTEDGSVTNKNTSSSVTNTKSSNGLNSNLYSITQNANSKSGAFSNYKNYKSQQDPFNINKYNNNTFNLYKASMPGGSNFGKTYNTRTNSSRTSTSTNKNFNGGLASGLSGGLFGRSMANTLINSKALFDLIPAKGGSSRDLPIGYGLLDPLANIMKNIGSVGFASYADGLGQDYDTAKNSYLSSFTSGVQTSANGSSNNSTNSGFVSTEDASKNLKDVPSGYGKIHTYMGWQCITSPTSDQMKLRNAVESYDSEGFGRVGDRYAVAMKKYYGSVGDYLNITQDDGFTYKVALADIKGSENGSSGIAKYVHGDGSMVEFVVDKKSWYSKEKGGNAASMHANPGSSSFHPELGHNIVKIEHVGNYWKNDSKDLTTYKGSGTIKKFLSPLRKTRAIGYGGNWLQIVQAVKKALADLKLGYSQSRYITLNVLGQTLQNVRTDCSGYVSACLRLYGALTSNTNSSGFVTMNSMNGFTKHNWTGWDSLQPGDIITKNGHVEIFASNSNGAHNVWTCGSTSSCNNPGTNTDNRSYTVVWRPNEAGALTNMDTTQQASSGTSSNPLMSIFSGITNGLMSAVNNTSWYGPGSSRTPAGWFTQTLNGSLTSGYGKRNSVFGNEYHRGLDIASSKGTSIYSPIDGVLVSSGNDVAGYGNYAVVRSADGNNHLFAHLNKPVGYGVGTRINKNDIIGEVGSTGKSTGDHLHYEIRRNGNKYSAINPMNYKYDRDVAKNLNVNSQNTKIENNIGGASKDITMTNIKDKLNIALNTENVETKLDSLIEVMKTWAERESKASTTQNNTNITTNNVSYGTGKSQKSTQTIKKSTKDLTSKNLVSIHKAIASKA